MFSISLQLCIHAQNGRKCQYVGNCSFAHSPEEREMWTFMKENKSEWNVCLGAGGNLSSILVPHTPVFRKATLRVMDTLWLSEDVSLAP